MNGKGYLLVLCLVAAGCSHMRQPSSAPDAGAAPTISKAANPDLPQGVPGWKQGMSDAHASSPLAPHAGKMTVTPDNEIPLSSLKVPPGFKVELWASGMPGVRIWRAATAARSGRARAPSAASTRSRTRAAGATSRVLVDKLTQPNGVAFKDGNLYVVAIDKVLRYDGIEYESRTRSRWT